MSRTYLFVDSNKSIISLTDKHNPLAVATEDRLLQKHKERLNKIKELPVIVGGRWSLAPDRPGENPDLLKVRNQH